jgi:plastocyanin
MDILDSRSLRYVDCYIKKFSELDQISYQITTAAGVCLPLNEEGFTIIVNECIEQEEGNQHDVTIRREGQKLVADPAHLEINSGDVVLWHAADPSIPGFVVFGRGKCSKFDSTALTGESVYTHAFGMPGEYKWIDANRRTVSGVVEVYSPDSDNKQDCRDKLGALTDGMLITICEDKVTPARVKVLVGQTVFWAIERASGISITDAGLVVDLLDQEKSMIA